MIHCEEYAKTVYRIIGCAMNVHRELGGGLLEAVYQEALSLELSDHDIINDREKEIDIYYKGHLLKKKYKMDIMVGDIIIELKSASEITNDFRAQLCNYLHLTRKPIGILINFGQDSLKGERWAYDYDTNECVLIDKNMKPVRDSM